MRAKIIYMSVRQFSESWRINFYLNDFTFIRNFQIIEKWFIFISALGNATGATAGEFIKCERKIKDQSEKCEKKGNETRAEQEKCESELKKYLLTSERGTTHFRKRSQRIESQNRSCEIVKKSI